MFEVTTSKGYDAGKLNFVNKAINTYEFIGRTRENYGLQGFVEKLQTEPNNENTISVSQIGAVHAQIRKNKWYSSQNIFVLTPKSSRLINLLVVTSIDKILVNYGGYSSYPTLQTLKEHIITLPEKNGEIDFDFMEAYVRELEEERVRELEEERVRELSAYLKVSGLDNYELSEEEKQAINKLDTIKFEKFNLEMLFGKSTRGKRLKSAERVNGNLPFVTAGETDEGISAFIGNNVDIFEKNTTTIDMFGSAKYRNYQYGGDDHVAIVHTEKLPMNAAIFVTSAIHKVSHNGQFDYGRNFYAKDADALDILLPIKNLEPDYEYMALVISAVHKLVIKDVILWADKNIGATKMIVGRDKYTE